MEVAIRKAKEVGAEVQGAIAYTTGKVFTTEYYLKKVEELLALDVDVITIKDMAGLLTPPWKAYELVSEIKENYGVPVDVHTHSTTGMAVATYLKAVEAGGADYINTAISRWPSEPPSRAYRRYGTPFPRRSGLTWTGS